jgi:hypothetical protein
MLVFNGLSNNGNYNNYNNKFESTFLNSINKFKNYQRRGVNEDSEGRKYFFRRDLTEDNENINIPLTQSQKITSFSPEPKKSDFFLNDLNLYKDNKGQLNRINSYFKYKNSKDKISNQILKEQQKINNLELNEIYRIQKHNEIMGQLINENIRKKQILKDLQNENKKEKYKSIKEIHYIYYPKTIKNNNIIDELRKENLKLNSNLKLIKLNHIQSINSLKENLNKVIEENEKINFDKNKLKTEINALKDEIYKRDEEKSKIKYYHIRTQSLPEIRNNFSIEKEEKNEENEIDDDEWIKKLIKRNNYLLKRCYEYDDRCDYFRCYGG